MLKRFMNILIVEDSELICRQLVRLLEPYPAIHVIGTASTEAEAVEKILSNPIDAVLLDLSLASGNGLQVLQRVKAAGHSARFLILSSKGGRLLRDACLALGAYAYYDKNSEIDACLAHLQSWIPFFSQYKGQE
ncbi:response regulator [Rhodoferax sp. GW822-FHT02A01]|uniref:response regulator n=1 Tax=Rhodoferax sp. GW822-FHT02A01 TaxID=3141537 RepID=UPI00315D34CD